MVLQDWEVIPAKRWRYSPKEVEATFCHAIASDALRELYHEDPSQIHIASLSKELKAMLLKEDYDTFKHQIEVDQLPLDYIIALFISRPADFRKYIDFESLSRKRKGVIAAKRPGYFKRFGFETRGINGSGWNRLLRHDPDEFIPRFVSSITDFRNKTELRTLIGHYPAVIRHLTADAMKSSVLTAKEWALFLSYDSTKDAGVCYTDEVCDWLEQEISVEILSTGKSSVPLAKALYLIKK